MLPVTFDKNKVLITHFLTTGNYIAFYTFYV
jgi:hypothetical protein